MTLGQIIHTYRKENGISMDEFARQSGISKAYISILERNNNPISQRPPVPSLEKIRSAGNAMGKSLNEMLTLMGDSESVPLETEVISLTFGEKLKAARKQKKLTQKELASMINAAHNSISNWENDQNKPDSDTILNLCCTLDVTPNYFFLDTGSVTSTTVPPDTQASDLRPVRNKYPDPRQGRQSRVHPLRRFTMTTQDELKTQIAALGRRCGASRIVLFGSRARGDHRDRSDIDLAVFGLPQAQESVFLDGIDDLPTLLDFDVVFVASYTSPELLKNIEKDGVEIMNQEHEKLEQLRRAVKRLEEVILDYDNYQLDSLKDAVIQRFSFCSELAWKSTRETLLENGFLDLNSPKAVMRKAYAANLVSDEQVWLDLLKARNLAAHVYNEETANEIFEQIRTRFLPAFRQLIAALESA